EFGNRIFRNETDAFMLGFGLKGDNILEKWNFDASVYYSEVQDTARNTLVSSSRFNRAMNAADPIFDPASTDYIGTSIPYNPFGYYQVPIASNALVTEFAKVTTKDLNESKVISYNFVLSTAE